MTDVYCPNLDLFVYSLREGLGYRDADIEENQGLFWQLLPDEVQTYREDLFLAEKKTATPHYLELLNCTPHQQEVCVFKEPNSSEFPPVQGYYYPVRLYDTYGLMIDCYLAAQDPSTMGKFPPETERFEAQSSVARLKNYAAHFPDNFIDSEVYLGKTWMISGCIDPKINPKSMVAELYEGLELGKFDSKTCRWGKFLGVECCEIYQPPPQWKERDQEIHVLFFFFPDLDKFDQFSGFYKTWMELFHYHHKMNWAYWQTRELKRRMMVRYGESFEIAKTLRDLTLLELEEKLQKTTETLSDYVDNISYFGIQPHTIATNLTNYEDCLQELQNYPETDLGFLAQFASIVKKKYLPQIESDRQTLHQGLRVLENLLQSIRGKIQIEQTKSQQEQIESDRQLNETIQVFGTGIAFASVTAAIASTQVKDPEPPALSSGEAFGLSLLMGALAALGMAWFVRSERKK